MSPKVIRAITLTGMAGFIVGYACLVGQVVMTSEHPIRDTATLVSFGSLGLFIEGATAKMIFARE